VRRSSREAVKHLATRPAQTSIAKVPATTIRSGIGGSITEIPTGGVSIGNRIYAWYMAVNFWGPPGQWTNSHAGLAYWQPGDTRFTVVPGFQFPSNSNFGMVAASFRPAAEGANDDNLYIWGTPPGRFGGVKLARVPADEVANMSSYRYFDGLAAGEPLWTASEFDANHLVQSNVGEMSVMYNEAVGQWTMMYFNELRAAIELRQAPEPWGPWSAPLTITTSAQTPGGMYAPYMNPLYVENGGQTVYFTMSLWDTYDVYLAKATFRIVPEPSTALLVFAGVTVFLWRRCRRRL
jgi:D-arabinan endo alpha-(1,5)-arabinofuranosidase